MVEIALFAAKAPLNHLCFELIILPRCLSYKMKPIILTKPYINIAIILLQLFCGCCFYYFFSLPLSNII